MSNIIKNTLAPINGALENYFTDSIVPQLFVDSNMILRNFTSPAGELFSISREIIDKSVHNLRERIGYHPLTENIRGVLLTERNLCTEVQTIDGRRFQMNIQPCFCTPDGEMEGVIITFLDKRSQIASRREFQL